MGNDENKTIDVIGDDEDLLGLGQEEDFGSLLDEEDSGLDFLQGAVDDEDGQIPPIAFDPEETMGSVVDADPTVSSDSFTVGDNFLKKYDARPLLVPRFFGCHHAVKR